MARAPMDLSALTFGVEIEVTGMAPDTAAAVVRNAIPGGLPQPGRATECLDAAGRTWKAVWDSSISPAGAEVVTPPLRLEDMPVLQEVIRALRTAGARVNESCGIHVHVGSGGLDAPALRRLACAVYRYEWVIDQMVRPLPARRERYARPMEECFARRMANAGGRVTEDQINMAWYGHRRAVPCPGRYDWTRYSGMNLNSHFLRGTVEFRWFNGTLHAGLIRAYVVLCLSLVAAAAAARKASGLRFTYNEANPKYATHLLLRRLGIEDKAVRTHLEGHVTGIAAWKDGYPAGRRPAGQAPEQPAEAVG